MSDTPEQDEPVLDSNVKTAVETLHGMDPADYIPVLIIVATLQPLAVLEAIKIWQEDHD
jgi:hypothetical protein